MLGSKIVRLRDSNRYRYIYTIRLSRIVNKLLHLTREVNDNEESISCYRLPNEVMKIIARNERDPYKNKEHLYRIRIRRG